MVQGSPGYSTVVAVDRPPIEGVPMEQINNLIVHFNNKTNNVYHFRISLFLEFQNQKVLNESLLEIFKNHKYKRKKNYRKMIRLKVTFPH